MKTSHEIREAFIKYWEESPRNSKMIPNASLVPLNDPTLLFVNSGMFPIVPYLAGQPHPLGKRLHNVQRCIRTGDIEEVGDNRHMVMFEMIGNWSLGDFTKEEQIPWIMEFYIDVCGLDPKRLYITVFAGDESAPRDDVAIESWKKAFKKYGIDAEFTDDINNIPPLLSSKEETLNASKDWKYRIFAYPKKKNWWTRAAIPGEIGGPCSEMFYDFGVKERDDESYHVNDDSGRFVEIGNNVFMEYKMDENHNWLPLAQKNIDFGGGFDRIVLASKDITDPYLTDLFKPSIELIEKISGKKYPERVELNDETKTFRVIAEHARSSTFILADGIKPGNKDQSYILRRLIRRMVRFGLKLGIQNDFTKELAISVINQMQGAYPHLKENEAFIIDEIDKEEINFRRTLEKGLNLISKIFNSYLEFVNLQQSEENKGDYKTKDGVSYSLHRQGFNKVTFGYDKASERDGYVESLDLNGAAKLYSFDDDKIINGNKAFFIYETYGFPIELLIEEVKELCITKGIYLEPTFENELTNEFNLANEEHKKKSRAGAEQKFKGGLADSSIETTKLHTAHHLLLAALQKVVSPDIKQRGSNITSERLRIDFNLDRKLTPEEISKVEDLVNEKISEGLKIFRKIMPLSQAETMGAQMEFGQKYPEDVSVYFIHKPFTMYQVEAKYSPDALAAFADQNTVPPLSERLAKALIENSFSIEFCGGPHVENTSELGEGGKRFKIIEQENIGSGLKRIKARLV